MKAARKNAPLQFEDSETESGSDSESASGSSCPSSDSDSSASSSKTRETVPSRPLLSSQHAVTRHEVPPIHSMDNVFSDGFMDALQRLSLSTLRMQHSRPRTLPFLLRNLRRGFKKVCNRLGIPTTSTVPFPPNGVKVLLGYSKEERIFTVMMTRSWLCPLCELHGIFETPDMLKKHLQWDHSSVRVRWEGDQVSKYRCPRKGSNVV
jgi:hypothetical protein